MNANRNDKAWAARLEAGREDDPLLELAAELKRAGEETQAAPTVAFQRQLRRDLLNQYERPAARPWHVLGRWAASALAVIVLAAAVGLTWFSISGSGRPSFGGAALTEPATNPPGGAASVYRLLDDTITGVITETATTIDPAGQTVTKLLTPGVNVEVTTHWSLPPDAGPVSAFVHLLDSEGHVVAQADGPVEAAEDAANPLPVSTLALTLPADLSAGTYELIGGLYVPTTGTRLTVNTDDGQFTAIPLGQYEVPEPAAPGQLNEAVLATLIAQRHDILHAQLLESQEDALLVHDVSPTAGTTLGSAAPLEFAITVDYAFRSAPAGILEVQIVEMQSGEAGRVVGLATVENLVQGTGTVTAVVVVNPATALSGPADLGLWLQLRTDAASPPLLIEMPESFGWRYEP